MKRPRSSRFAKKTEPIAVPPHILIRSPRRPRTQTHVLKNGFSWKPSAPSLAPVREPRRRSVTPAAIQMRVPAGSPIIRANIPARWPVLLLRLPVMRTCPFGQLIPSPPNAIATKHNELVQIYSTGSLRRYRQGPLDDLYLVLPSRYSCASKKPGWR